MMPTSHRLHSALLQIRPAQLGELVKTALRIERTTMVTRTGHRFWADPVSVFGAQLATHGIYEAGLTRIVLSLLRPEDVFIDVGANEGYFSVMAGSRIRSGVVHAIEPQSRCEAVLRRNAELNGSSIVVHRCAVSDRNGTTDLFLRPSSNTGASSVFRHWRLGSRRERVPCLTLDSFFERNAISTARLIKIDCEGAEHRVVQGARRILAERRVELLAMDYHRSICGKEACLATDQMLRRAGYTLSVVSGQLIYHLRGAEQALHSIGEVSLNPELQERSEASPQTAE